MISHARLGHTFVRVQQHEICSGGGTRRRLRRCGFSPAQATKHPASKHVWTSTTRRVCGVCRMCRCARGCVCSDVGTRAAPQGCQNTFFTLFLRSVMILLTEGQLCASRRETDREGLAQPCSPSRPPPSSSSLSPHPVALASYLSLKCTRLTRGYVAWAGAIAGHISDSEKEP